MRLPPYWTMSRKQGASPLAVQLARLSHLRLKSMQAARSMRGFIGKHWFNIATLTVSLVALFVAFQRNRIALPKMEVMNDERPYGEIFVSGCNNRSDVPYELRFSARDYFTFVNNGGRKTALRRVIFTEGDRTHDYGSAYEPYREGGSHDTPLILPSEIDAGVARIWVVSAGTRLTFKSIEEALSAINLRAPVVDQIPETKQPYRWKFVFSDGSIVTTKQKEAYYNYQPNIDKWLADGECHP